MDKRACLCTWSVDDGTRTRVADRGPPPHALRMHSVDRSRFRGILALPLARVREGALVVVSPLRDGGLLLMLTLS